MEYIIKVCGEVVDDKYKAYVVNANTAEEAKNIAKTKFRTDYLTNGNVMIMEKPFMRKGRAIFSLVAMIIPILLSLVSWKYNHDTVSISPDFISCLYGVLLYSAFVIRFKGIGRTVETKTDILFTIVIAVLLSSFVKIILLEGEINILHLFKIPVNTNVMLIVSLILSWLGLKIISLICVFIVIMLALGNIVDLNAAMGSFWGSVYVVSSFIGIVTYASIEPAFDEIKNSISRFFRGSVRHFNNDLSEAKEHVSATKKYIEKKKNNKIKVS